MEGIEQQIQEDADRVARAMAAAKAGQIAPTKLAKEHIEDFAKVFTGIAAYYQPHNNWRIEIRDGKPVKTNENSAYDNALFTKYATLAIDAWKALAPFQSPTFKAIQVMAPPRVENPRESSESMIDIDDPVALARIYQRRITAVR